MQKKTKKKKKGEKNDDDDDNNNNADIQNALRIVYKFSQPLYGHFTSNSICP